MALGRSSLCRRLVEDYDGDGGARRCSLMNVSHVKGRAGALVRGGACWTYESSKARMMNSTTTPPKRTQRPQSFQALLQE